MTDQEPCLPHFSDTESDPQLRLVVSGRRPTSRQSGCEAPYAGTAGMVEMLSRILLLVDI